MGGHAITLIGYDDSAKAWIVRNSWGEDWGEKGYFRIAYDDASGVGNQTWGLEVPSAKGYVTLGGLRERAVLSGTVTLNLESTVSDTTSVEYAVKKNDRVIHWGGGRNGSRVKVDTTQFPDGAYTIVAQANTKGGLVLSQPRTIYVLNGSHQGTVELTNLSEGEVLSDKKELQIRTSGTPVPFTSIKLSKSFNRNRSFTKSFIFPITHISEWCNHDRNNRNLGLNSQMKGPFFKG
ncbi:MAG: hypothetical protein EB120_07290 [Proteobacteria bacterium]|nr:hypothetical protein [Pseudomonadota bacterium]